MRRNRGRVCRDGGLRAKRDTPVKATVAKRQKLQPRNVYDALPEETHAPPAEPGHRNMEPVHSKRPVALRSAAFSENPRNNIHPDLLAPLTAGPAVTAEPEPLISHSELVLKEKEQDGQSLAATSESVISSSVESDTTFNSDDDDDDDCYSSTFSSSNTLPSPEIFRRENDAETETFCIKAQQLALHPIVRNSTLLDVSCAQSIHTHQPPDLSAISKSGDRDTSPLLVGKCEIRFLDHNNRGPEGDTQIQKDSLKSDNNDIKCKTPAKLTRKKPILCKKVVFKSPIMAEYLEVKDIPATSCTILYTTDLVHALSPAGQMKPAEKASVPGERNSKEDPLLLSVKPKRPVKGSAEKAKFFDFVSDKDEDVFFRMARERSVKLKSAPLFPLTAAKHQVPSVW